jgi:hypothetical protein
MRNRLISTIALAAVLAACGGGGSDADAIADQLIDEADAEGMDLDEACVREVAAKFEGDDVAKVKDGDFDGLSEAGQATAVEALQCLSTDSIATQLLDSLPDDGSIDKECIADAIKDLDATALTSGDPALTQAMIDCAVSG